MSETLVFYVNGKKVTEPNPCPRTLLADYLRYKLKLTGTKIACGEGACGSCTVMISHLDRSTSKILHYTVNSCITPICALHGLAITTIEGLGSTKTKLHQLQEKLVAGHGIQCGYCTPGMVMSMYALLRNNPKPTEIDIEHALKGNLCRCTGYRPILDSFRSFSKGCPMGERCCQNQPKGAVDPVESGVDNPYAGKQELIFPNELQLSDSLDKDSLHFKSDAATWYRPLDLTELLKLKKQHPAAMIYAGGTCIAFRLKKATPQKPLIVISATQVHDLQALEEKDGGLWIGAMTSLTQLEVKLSSLVAQLPEPKTRLITALLDLLQVFGSPQLRGRVTIGGTLATAVSNVDVNVMLLATGCRVRLVSASGHRDVLLQENFYVGHYQTCLKPDEVIQGIQLPFSSKDDYFENFKQSPRKDMTMADINGGMHVEFEDGRDVVKAANLVFGGISPLPFSAKKTSATLRGRKWESGLVDEILTCIANELGTTLKDGEMDKYKLAVAQGFFFKFFLKVYNKRFQKLDFWKMTAKKKKVPTATLR